MRHEKKFQKEKLFELDESKKKKKKIKEAK